MKELENFFSIRFVHIDKKKAVPLKLRESQPEFTVYKAKNIDQIVENILQTNCNPNELPYTEKCYKTSEIRIVFFPSTGGYDEYIVSPITYKDYTE